MQHGSGMRPRTASTTPMMLSAWRSAIVCQPSGVTPAGAGPDALPGMGARSAAWPKDLVGAPAQACASRPSLDSSAWVKISKLV